MAQKADEAYMSLLPEKRRKLIRLVFTNLKLDNGKFTFEYTNIFSKLAEAIKFTNSSKVVGNEEFEEKILEQADLVGVKANISGFEPVRSNWLGLVEDFRTFQWTETIPYPELVYQESVKLVGALV